ncbi:carboxymuconolactone decarboxylase family protein [Aeromicrobium sp. Leaf350]|uniref:carboxymuconolactone decarboxylase family protein n=1 Tax=Aeromicrobium sp. Leaf350 TaxID=2876565 RepID=UPI001E492AF7|nr:carboxymuconolactone decarboxylase family protein [Aeromicrobium sp. Leaf350]
MAVPDLPLLDAADVPAALTAQVERLEGLDADTSFHRYISHAPHMVDFFWRDFYTHVFHEGIVPLRTKEVVRLALAALSGCTFCRIGDIDSALKNGLTQEQVDGVLALDPSSLPADEQVAFALAVRLSPFAFSDEIMDPADWSELRQHFTDAQVSELLLCTSVLAGVGRMLVISGFVPRVCELPAPQA